MAFALVLGVLLSCLITARAASIQEVTPAATLSISGETATCRVRISQSGKSIQVTMQLWQGGTLIDSWSKSGTTYVSVKGIHDVIKGKTYTVKVLCTVDGRSLYIKPVTKTA